MQPQRARRVALLPFAAALGGFAAIVSTADAQPSLSYVAPAAVAPGQTTQLTLHGAKLAGPLRVWTSFAADVEVLAGSKNDKAPKDAKCKLTLPPGTSAGIGGLVVANSDGASDVVYLMIDDLPSIAASGSNHSAATAQPVSLPIAIDAPGSGTEADYYRLEAKAGQPISVEAVATRLGWDFDPVIRVLDAAGRELLLADDDPATGADARFIFTPPADGAYVLEVRDNRYKAGGRYRLRLGDFPLVTAPLPLVAQRGAVFAVDWRGPGGQDLSGMNILPIGGSITEPSLTLSVKSPGLGHAGWGVLGMTDLPVTAYSSIASNEAQPIDVPCAVSGVLAGPGERNTYEFAAKKGSPLRFTAISSSLGSPAILALRAYDAAGKQLVESPVTQSDEPVLNFNPPADGKYRLVVEDLVGRGGADFVYAVECRTGPQFSLLLKNDKNSRLRFNIASGGAIALDVQCQRVGYDGPITLEVESPQSGWQLINRTIPAKVTETKLYLLPPLDFSAGSLAALRIVGRGEVSGRHLTAAMTTTLQLRTSRPQMPYPPAWHDGAIFVGGVGPKPAFFHVAAAESVEVDRAAGEGKLAIQMERIDAKFKDPLTILPIGVPAGVSAEVKRNGNGPKETYDLVLKGKELPKGEHSIRYLAYGELAGQGRGVLSGEVRLTLKADAKPADATKPTDEKKPAAADQTAKSP